MTDRSSHAFLASLLLHGLIAAAFLFSAYWFHDDQAQTKIMELVAGAGDNYGATEAPALGSPDSQKMDTAAAEASPVAGSAEPKELEAVATPQAVPAHPLTRTPDFTRQIDRVEKRVMKRIEKQQKAEAEKEAKAEVAREKAAAAAVKNNQMTKAEFDRRYGSKTSSTERTSGIKVAKIDGKGIAAGVVGGSTANTKGGAGGTALSREEGDMLDAYFSLLVQRLKDAHNRPDGLSDLLTAKAEFLISHDGTISDVSIVQSSGSPEFDQSVLSAFRNVGSIGPRPDSGGTLRRTVTFKMKDD